jgi:hypothetical protein
MPTRDDLTNDHPLPLFLANHAEEPEQLGIGKAWDGAVISSRILKTGILIVTATVIGVGVISVGNPVILLSNVRASLFDTSASQLGTGQSKPTNQSNAGTQDLLATAGNEPPIDPDTNSELAPRSDGKTTTTDVPTRSETAAALQPAEQSQAEAGQLSADDLFKQFQAWAAEQDGRTQVRSVQPAQDAPVQVVQDTGRQVRPTQGHRQVRHAQNARAEVRPVQIPRKKIRREQNAQVPSVQDARAQAQSVQNAETPSFLQSLGLRN